MKLSKMLWLAMMLLIVAACSKDDDDDDNTGGSTDISIVVGEGLSNDVKIGAAMQTANDAFGSGSLNSAGINNEWQHSIIYFTKGVQTFAEKTTNDEFDASMKIAYVTVTSPFEGKTPEGIGIGSTKTEVEAAYGAPVSSIFTDKYSNGLEVDYEAGVAISIAIK